MFHIPLQFCKIKYKSNNLTNINDTKKIFKILLDFTGNIEYIHISMMTITTNKNLVNGTTLQGYLQATYDTIVKILGEPTRGPSADNKTTCGWILKNEDGNVATLYDWKTETTPLSPYNWHIGGFDDSAVLGVQELFPEHKTTILKF
jgi:hypothetical protein